MGELLTENHTAHSTLCVPHRLQLHDYTTLAVTLPVLSRMRTSKSLKKAAKVEKVTIHPYIPKKSLDVAVENAPTAPSSPQHGVGYNSSPQMDTPLSKLHADLDMFMSSCSAPRVVADIASHTSPVVNPELPELVLNTEQAEVIDLTGDTVDIIDLTKDTPERTTAHVVTDVTEKLADWLTSIPCRGTSSYHQ